ncbi:MAG: DNA replication/repair protein RecF [Gammaproteobacteria bacterium]|nr:DNA replication/repair protein RecF [Gammaproteobacteria bacterium]
MKLVGDPLLIKKLKIENFRNLVEVEIEPDYELNFFNGANGAGKTSVIESIVVLSRGRSFRTNQSGELVGPEQKTFRVYAETSGAERGDQRLGLERSGNHWRARKDGQELSQLSQLTRSMPLMLMEPNSHLLVSGTPEIRRKYIDWGMFHVEQQFLDTWRRYSKILKQRNAALRSRQETLLDSLDEVMSESGTRLTRLRKDHFTEISGIIQSLLGTLSKDLSGVDMEYEPGWRGESLKEALLLSRERDLERGMTCLGPHRADISLKWRNTVARAILSRGEQKILSAALLISQAIILSQHGDKPLILLDDLASEFDEKHFEAVLEQALSCGGQVWVTGARGQETIHGHKVFHVEHGRVREVL